MVWSTRGLCAISLTVLAPLCTAYTDTRAPDRPHNLGRATDQDNTQKLMKNNPGYSTWVDRSVDPGTDSLHDLGLFKLNNWTLNKLISMAVASDKDHALLIRFYKEDTIPHGKKEEDPMYHIVPKLNHIHGLVLGEMMAPYQDEGLRDQTGLVDRFSIEYELLPTYILFNKAHPTGLQYHGNENFGDLSLWLHIKAGLEIEHETLDDFNKLVKAFLRTSDANLINKAMIMATESGEPMGIYYPKYMHKLQEKGPGFITKEQDRIRTMLHGHLPHDARSELSEKLKVLGVFAKALKEAGAEL